MSELIESLLAENKKLTKTKPKKVVKEDYDYDEFERIYSGLPSDVKGRMESGWNNPSGNFMSRRKEFIAYCTALFDAGLISKSDIDLLDQMQEDEGNYLGESKKRVTEASHEPEGWSTDTSILSEYGIYGLLPFRDGKGPYVLVVDDLLMGYAGMNEEDDSGAYGYVVSTDEDGETMSAEECDNYSDAQSKMEDLYDDLMMYESTHRKKKVSESKKKVVKESDELSQVQVFDPANFIEYGRFVNRKKLGQYLRDNGYKIVKAYYKDANHNRQSWDMIFSNGKDYIRYRRFAGKGPYASDAPEELIVSSKIPKDSYDRLDQIVSYDYVHDYSKEPDYFKSRFSKDLLIESKKAVKR